MKVSTSDEERKAGRQSRIERENIENSDSKKNEQI